MKKFENLLANCVRFQGGIRYRVADHVEGEGGDDFGRGFSQGPVELYGADFAPSADTGLLHIFLKKITRYGDTCLQHFI